MSGRLTLTPAIEAGMHRDDDRRMPSVAEDAQGDRAEVRMQLPALPALPSGLPRAYTPAEVVQGSTQPAEVVSSIPDPLFTPEQCKALEDLQGQAPHLYGRHGDSIRSSEYPPVPQAILQAEGQRLLQQWQAEKERQQQEKLAEKEREHAEMLNYMRELHQENLRLKVQLHEVEERESDIRHQRDP